VQIKRTKFEKDFRALFLPVLRSVLKRRAWIYEAVAHKFIALFCVSPLSANIDADTSKLKHFFHSSPLLLLT
jgi:hypothetical protein